MQVLISSSAELSFIKDAYSSAVNSYFEQNHWMSQGTVRPFNCYCALSPDSVLQIKETYKAMMQIEGSIVSYSISSFARKSHVSLFSLKSSKGAPVQ
jgi:hypothetical protein